MDYINYGKHYIDQEDIDSVINVLKNYNLTQGSFVEEFEEKIASYVGSKYAVVTNSGTAALHIAYLSLFETNNDLLLITSANTFVSTVNAGIFQNASVQLIDIDINTGNISIEKLTDFFINSHNLIKNKNIIVVPVHFSGAPCDMQRLKNLSTKYNFSIVEDASHALGASFQCGSKVGSCKYSDLTTFSFHPVKSITTGEGGAVTTNSYEVYKKLIKLRSHGINKLDDNFEYKSQAFTENTVNPWYYEMQTLGFNYRLTDIQSVLGISQIKKLNLFINRRREIAKLYEKYLKNICNIEPLCPFNNLSSYHLFVVLIDFDKIGITKNYFMNQLKTIYKIVTQVHYIPVYRHPYYFNQFKKNNFHICDSYYKQALSLPIFYELKDEQVKYVVDSISNIING